MTGTAAAGDDYPLLDLFWTMLLFSGFVIWLWLLIVVVTDLLRREDVGGWAKAGWTALLVLLPMIGVLVYLVAQGGGMADRRRAATERAREDFEIDVLAVLDDVPAPAPADQIAAAARLRDHGDITSGEYELLKRRSLGLPAADPVRQAR